MSFFQTGPVPQNEWRNNLWLHDFLAWKIPADRLPVVDSELDRFGARAATEFWAWEKDAERNLPEHVPYSPWGERVDEIRMSEGWKNLVRAAAEEGIVATGYERKHGEYSRLVQMAKLYLFHPSSAFVSCPLAMTDGAAKLLEIYGTEEQKKRYLTRLCSRDPERFFISGQWMTERRGGSDVGGTETIAEPDGDGFRLSGVKWFSSAITADMAMALARLPGAPSGSRGLTVFLVPIRNDDGSLNGIQVNRLKDKLGTRAMPTAELTLTRAWAEQVGEAGQGVATIASLFNVTRIYNSVFAISTHGRALSMARSYGGQREAFGKKLLDHPLHLETLAASAAEEAMGLMLTLELGHLLGREEAGLAAAEEILSLRLLTPVAKLFTGKLALAHASESIEAIGGAAYIEDTDMPRLLRNAQVFSIWEGTTNILCLDALRAVTKENAFVAVLNLVRERLAVVASRGAALAASESALVTRGRAACLAGFQELEAYLGRGADVIRARDFAFGLARAFSFSLLLDYWVAPSTLARARGRLLPVLQRQLDQGLVRFQGGQGEARHAENQKIFGLS